jgi:hypothetical protein
MNQVTHNSSLIHETLMVNQCSYSLLFSMILEAHDCTWCDHSTWWPLSLSQLIWTSCFSLSSTSSTRNALRWRQSTSATHINLNAWVLLKKKEEDSRGLAALCHDNMQIMYAYIKIVKWALFGFSRKTFKRGLASSVCKMKLHEWSLLWNQF